MFCGKCGTKINDGDSFCTNCGAKVVGIINQSDDDFMFDFDENIIDTTSNLKKQISEVKCVNEYEDDTKVIDMDSIQFGLYPQSLYKTNNNEPIEWLVLEKDHSNNRALLISKYGLFDDNYDENYRDFTGYEYVNWETSPLRKRLNDDFINAAFSIDEMELIESASVINTDYEEHTHRDGNDTTDKIFLLSINEVKKYFNTNKQRICYKAYDNNSICEWWLRTTFDGISRGVEEKGTISKGEFTPYFSYSVRPAMWVKI